MVSSKHIFPIPRFSNIVIKYTGIGSNFRTHFTETEFREIIMNNIMLFYFNENIIKNYHKYNSVITDPLGCNLDLLIEFSGAIKMSSYN